MMCRAELFGEPSGQLEFDEPLHSCFTRRLCSFTELERGVGPVPRGCVDQTECGSAVRVKPTKRHGNAAAHGTAGDGGCGPSHMVEQFSKVASEQFGGE